MTDAVVAVVIAATVGLPHAVQLCSQLTAIIRHCADGSNGIAHAKGIIVEQSNIKRARVDSYEVSRVID